MGGAIWVYSVLRSLTLDVRPLGIGFCGNWSSFSDYVLKSAELVLDCFVWRIVRQGGYNSHLGTELVDRSAVEAHGEVACLRARFSVSHQSCGIRYIPTSRTSVAWQRLSACVTHVRTIRWSEPGFRLRAIARVLFRVAHLSRST